MYSVSSYSAQGPRSTQEDRYLHETISADVKNGDGLLLAVMDGHCGNEVADILCQNLAPFFADALIETSGNIFNSFEVIVSELQSMTRQSDAGSTLSMVYIPAYQDKTKQYAYTCVIGDSPILIHGKNNITSMSIEHNAAVNDEDVDYILRNNKEKVQSGVLYISQGFVGLDTRYLQLTRAFGDHDFDEVILREPSIEKVEIDENSFIVVASDGVLYDETRETIYQNIIRQIKEGAEAKDIVQWALNKKAYDNVTVLVYHLSQAPA